jgi:hypothetical protein
MVLYLYREKKDYGRGKIREIYQLCYLTRERGWNPDSKKEWGSSKYFLYAL